MKGNFAVLISLLFLFINQVQAGVVIGGTRIIYPADQQEVQVALKIRIIIHVIWYRVG